MISKSDTKCFPPLDTVRVTGGRHVRGKINVAGSKVASVPIIAACIQSTDWVELVNLPWLDDVTVMLHLIQYMGGEVERLDGVTRICTTGLRSDTVLPADLVASVHGTIYLLPALLGRFGTVTIPCDFGGCQIGDRPIEHILGVMKEMGAEINIGPNAITAKATNLRGCDLSARWAPDWDKHRSGITKTALLLGICAEGETVINDAYGRASITELASFLRAAGAHIVGDGTSQVRVSKARLGAARYEIAGDYLEALTYLTLVAACRGEIEVTGVAPKHCEAELRLLSEMGLSLEITPCAVRGRGKSRLRAVSFTTSDIDTDIQPIITAALTLAQGCSVVEERVWEARFGYAQELVRMGAEIKIHDRQLSVEGVPQLSAADMHAQDLRAGASLLVAAAAARGTSTITGLTHLKRGYQNLPEGLRQVGILVQDVFSKH